MDRQAEITLKAEELRAALRAKLGVRGRALGPAIAKAGRLLPTKLRKQAGVIVKAQNLRGHPKLVRPVDMVALNRAIGDIAGILDAIDPKERRRTNILHWVGGLAFNLIAIVVLFVIWMAWSGNL
jgi:hypothetical protein